MREPVGYFLLERGGLAGPLPDKLLTSPHVVGQTIRVPWSTVNPSGGVFEWDEIDHRLAQCKRLNRLAKLIIQTGRDGLSPKWFGGQRVVADGNTAPAPWSPQMLAAWAKTIAEAGRRYNAHPALVGVHATGPTWPSAEMHPVPRMANKAGYSKRAMVDAWGQAIAATGEAFPSVCVCLSISVQPPVNSFVNDVIGNAHDFLGDRLRIQHNALKARQAMDPNAAHHELVKACHRLGIGVGFEMVTTVKDWQRFGSRNVMDGINYGKLAGGRYFDVYPQPEDVNGLRA